MLWNYKITGNLFIGKNNRWALFSGMGKDIVYLPMYCMDGEMVVAADPVLVQKDGKVILLS